MIKDNLFVRDGSGYYPSDALRSPAETAYDAACAASDQAGRAQVDVWYAEQTAPVRAELGIAQTAAVEAHPFLPSAALEAGAMAVKVA